MYIYQGWKYLHEPIAGKLNIEPNIEIERPKTFFKYYAVSKNSVDALTNMYVYASHPAQLNDPFDCDNSLAKIEDKVNARVLWEDLYDSVKEMYPNDNDFYKFSTETFTTAVFRKQGIICLAPTNTELIMWSNYAQNNGFCLEWDVSKFTFDHYGPFPIHYVREVEEASSLKYDVLTLALIQTNVKQECWKYEKEWRLIVKNPVGFDFESFGKYANEFNERPGLHNRKLYYPIEALKSITLGIHFFKEIEERQEIVSSNPLEIHVCYSKTCLQTRVLDFLSKITKYIGIQYMVKEGLSSKIIPIEIVRINGLTFRIIEK